MELRRECLLGAVICVVAIGCSDSPKGRTYYQRNIEPILIQKCAGNTSGCHSTQEGDIYKFAAGNLDVTSFENVQKRRDTLDQFGAYPYPLLLIKAVGAGKLKLSYGNDPDPTKNFRPIDVQHSGGGIIEVGSDAYFTLQTWLDNGATENGLKPATPPQVGSGGCSPAVPTGFNPATFNTNPNFATFKSTVMPILKAQGCTEGSCHGAPQSDFYITCGDDETQLAFNFSQAWSFVNTPVDDSQLLRVPLAVSAGGRGHTGGDRFPSTSDADFVKIRTWAEATGVLDFVQGDPAKDFFAKNVQPILLQRGCSFQACHSPSATNDFKLRSGTVGFFSAVALQRNYDLLKNEFLAFEFPDSRRSRAVAKTILQDDPNIVGVGGIEHRGGPVLETQGVGLQADPTCPGGPMSSTFCTVQAWVTLERASLLTAGQVTDMSAGQPAKIVYVERPAGSASAGRLEFDDFHGGAELRVATVNYGAGETIPLIDAQADTTSLSAGCAGIVGGDIQSPSVANDGTRVAFAARGSAAEPLGVFTVNIDGTNCQRVTPAVADSNGIKVHNFDPVWSPDGQYIVFASTRGKAGALKSRKRLLPQSDIWRIKLADNTVEQMTVLSNSEVGPGFMREGRVTMTTEKVSENFYQLSGRRINWDLTDYHPLLAQRKDSLYPDIVDLTTTKPSIGYSSATDIREGANGDFLVILSDTDTTGKPVVSGAAGALGIFNRSIGPFEQGRGDISFLPSLKIVGDAGATGRMGSTSGYRHPVSLPDGGIMVAFASSVATGNFEIFRVNPRDNSSAPMFTNGAGKIRVDAVLAYKYPVRPLFFNHRQLVFGGAVDAPDAGHAILYMPDAPLVFTLLTGNLRRGRPVDAFDKASFLAVYSEAMCPATGCTPGAGGFFESRMLLGKAPLASDGSVKVQLPSGTGVVLELQDSNGNTVVKMGEEHQLGPKERISMGVTRTLFNAVCAGCHGSITGEELDVGVTPDALTGASASASINSSAASVGP